MIGGAIESSNRTRRTALVRTGRRGGHAACYEEGGEDADAEVGLVWRERARGPTAGASAGNSSNLLWIRTQAMCQLVIIPEQKRVVRIYGCGDYYRKVDHSEGAIWSFSRLLLQK